MTRALRRLAMALLAAALAAGPARAERRVVDDAGQALTLAAPAQRIVSLAPHLTELLFAAGAGPQVVAVSAFSDFPPAARALPQVGDSARLDLERIVALRPDLVLVWRNGSPPQQLQRLAAAGLPVFASESRNLAHIAATLRQLGRLAGTEAAADARAAAFERQVAALRTRYAARPPLKVFYQLWPQPLMTVGGAHLLTEALQVCGARNVFDGLRSPTPTVDAEAVLLARPDAVVSAPGSAGGPDPLARWRGLRTLHAGFVTVDPDTLHRATDRMAQGLADLCAQLDRLR